MNNALFNENLIFDREIEIRKQEMKKMNRTAKLSMIPALLAALAVAIYLSAIPQTAITEIIIPINISGNIQTDNASPGIGSYHPENEHTFRVNPANSLSFFEKNKMDLVFATARYDNKKDIVWLLVRGVNYADLPNVTDYYTELERLNIGDGYIYETKGTEIAINDRLSERSYPILDENSGYASKFAFEGYQLSHRPYGRQDENSHKEIAVRQIRAKYGATQTALIALTGIITFVITHAALMRKKKQEIK